jgi:hypothetical protein
MVVLLAIYRNQLKELKAYNTYISNNLSKATKDICKVNKDINGLMGENHVHHI